MKTAIVTDTNSGITAQMAREMGIYLIPMPFFIDGSTYYEGETCTPDFFFRHLKAKAEVSTSQPSPEVITSLWASLLETHDAVLHFPMTAGLSGSCETAKALAQEFDGRVLVVDDHRISVTLAQSIRNAQTLLAQGKTAQEVRGILEAEKDASSIYIAVNTLEYLKKSGRVTAAGAAMAAVLHIKPVLQIQGGKLDAYKKVRGMFQAKKDPRRRPPPRPGHPLCGHENGRLLRLLRRGPRPGEGLAAGGPGGLPRPAGGADLPAPEHLLPHR